MRRRPEVQKLLRTHCLGDLGLPRHDERLPRNAPSDVLGTQLACGQDFDAIKSNLASKVGEYYIGKNRQSP